MLLLLSNVVCEHNDCKPRKGIQSHVAESWNNKIPLELSSSLMASSVVVDGGLRRTTCRYHREEITLHSTSDSETEPENDSETGSDSETEPHDADQTQEEEPPPGPSSAEGPAPFTGHGEAAQSQPTTDGNLRIHLVLECEAVVMACQFSIDGSLLAVGLADGSIKVYSTDNGDLIRILRDSSSVLPALPVTSLRFTISAQSHCLLLATYASGRVRCWYVWGGECVWWVREARDCGGRLGVREQRQTLCLSISASGERILTGGCDAAIHIYDLSTHQRLQIYRASSMRTVMDGHCSRVFAVTFHPERDTQFISGGWDSTIQFWDTRQEHSVRMFSGPHVCGEALHIDPSTNQILCGSWRKYNTLEAWDYNSGKKVFDVPEDPHGDSRVYTCHWFGQDYITAAGGQSNMLRVVDRHRLTTASRLFGLSAAVYSSAVCLSGKWAGLIAAASGDSVFLLNRN
ncbi:WD repeat-containing protein 38-like isoform X2 [Electrophorus electricus]|uniref:WD repeat-containing protein 38-like isoform X2 n=1 Tax=Electrophorus electricus TaxID=8005 RepID=UPI000F09A951|nr:WD repeat-containing protein 38-like isoform X2 [Electrophorus electricus]